ncbi:MAG: flagellar protein FlgN [Spongiibacteraceae bacterium]
MNTTPSTPKQNNPKQANPKQATPNWSLFDYALQQDIVHSEQLLSILLQEREALEAREYTDFENLITQKKTLVEQLEHNAVQRKRWLSQHGMTDDFIALDAAKKQAPEIVDRWQAAATVWRECQAANQVNEQICRRTRLVVENVLNILRGQNAPAATYNASGYSQNSPDGRTISNA